MGLFERFPYTNFHELNAGWMLQMMKELEAAWKQFTAGNSLSFADPLTYDATKSYAKNTIVLDGSGNAYISLQAVPKGVAPGNQDYWLMVFDYEAFMEKVNKNFTGRYYRDENRAKTAMVVGDWLTFDDVLCKAAAAIAVDDLLEVGVNIEHFTLEDFIKAFMTSANQMIQQYKHDIDASELAYRQQLAQDIANTTASLQAQLDAAISGATVDSEVINARVGADGITYPTLGDAIRGQITKCVKNYGNIDSGNYSTKLPSSDLNDLPANSISYISNNHSFTHSPNGQHSYVVRTYSGYNNPIYAKYQTAYDADDNITFYRYSADSVTWTNWTRNATYIQDPFRTYGNINNGNYLTMLPSADFNNLPVNTITYVANDKSYAHAPNGQHAYVIRVYTGYSNHRYAIYQEAYDATDDITFFRYTPDTIDWTRWKQIDKQTFNEMCEDNYYVHTCINKPITLTSGVGLYIFGDSIATDTHGGFTWGSVIASRTGCTEYNRAVGSSGFTLTNSIISQVNNVSDWSHCDIAIIAAGTNEHLGGLPVDAATLRSAVQDVIDAIKTNAPNAEIIFITPIKCNHYKEYFIPEISGAICNVALTNGCSVIAGYEFPIVLTMDANSWITHFDDSDNLHPDANGKQVYAMSVLNAIL